MPSEDEGTLSLAVLEGSAPKAMEWKITHNEATVKRFVRRLTREGGEVRACYEAEPTGYELQRRRAGQPAEVVAIAERAQSGGRTGHVGVREQGEQFPKCAS